LLTSKIVVPFCITVQPNNPSNNCPIRQAPIAVVVPEAALSIGFALMELCYRRAGSGPPLVLIHGIGSRWQMWEPLLDRLVAEREVVAFDLPGFGASPMPPPGTPPGTASLTRLVGEFLDDLGLQRPHVAGNSLGGLISLELAKQGRVRSVTALSPGGFHTSREGIFERTSLQMAVRTARLLAPRVDRLSASPMMRQITWSQFVAHPRRIGAADAAASARALANAPWFDDTLPAILSKRFSGGERIDVPVTIAWGEKDRLLLPRQAPRAARAIPGARLVMLTGCGHVPTYDDPEQVARVLLDGSSP
jgi:pimeloyl-ACP methyl ester carboxylesterase